METWKHGAMEMEKWKHGDKDMETWKHGEMEKWRHGDMETWSHGDMETWRHGDMVTWRHGDMVTWRHEDMNTWRYGDLKRKTEAQAIFLNPFPACSLCKLKFVICPFADEQTNGSYCSLSLWRVARGSKHMSLELIHGLFIT
jgi:hypothetical protein